MRGGRISELRTAESPPRAPPFWPPLESCLVYIVYVMLIMLKIFEFFDQGAANFLAGHFQDV